MDSIGIHGLIRAREHPFGDDLEALAYWWFAEWQDGRMIRPPRMSEREKDRYTVYEHANILTTAGRTAILNYLALATTTGVPFGKIFSVGTGSLAAVFPGDTAISGELARVAPSAATVTGTQIDIPTSFGSGVGNGTWTNVGLFGTSSATTTLATGTLYTHSLFSYTKASGVSVVIDYLISLN